MRPQAPAVFLCAAVLGLAAAVFPARAAAGEGASLRIAGKPAAPVALRVLRLTPAAPGERFELELAVEALLPGVDVHLEWRSSPDVAIEEGVREQGRGDEPLVLRLRGRRTATGPGRVYVVARLGTGDTAQRRALAIDVGGQPPAPESRKPGGRTAGGLRILPAEVSEGSGR
jgi:hypothetical protein